ncbi:integral membrane protein [Thiohalobacter thiocyanaticus]|uniref:Integral membrane protein n=1 Tax=Thiohalobacter thiocyanaticus TaxID=585455 RepID=A0A1Z4VLG5_9GAMM|nr:DUF2244 domain-containing protein [Thiohalobacter thiocyanaticus]BAZ92439.1 integral membrane protein [Thiohalobacter thiocyanaticus]
MQLIHYIKQAAFQEGEVVAAQCDANLAECYVLIRPNCSLTWRGSVLVFCGIFLVSMSIALGFWSQGLWLVLPFAGLEMLMLAAGLYLGALRTSEREVIRIEGDTVAIERGRRRCREIIRFPRGWARVELARAARPGYPSRLLIRSHGQAQEVGHCLNDQERDRLATDLRDWIHPGPAPA